MKRVMIEWDPIFMQSKHAKKSQKYLEMSQEPHPLHMLDWISFALSFNKINHLKKANIHTHTL